MKCVIGKNVIDFASNFKFFMSQARLPFQTLTQVSSDFLKPSLLGNAEFSAV